MERCKHMLKVDQCAFCTGFISKSSGSGSASGFYVVKELWLLNFYSEADHYVLNQMNPERKFMYW